VSLEVTNVVAEGEQGEYTDTLRAKQVLFA
jgi:hypothetical protein